jgi:hypothetical protein
MATNTPIEVVQFFYVKKGMLLVKEKNGLFHLPGLKNEDHLIPQELVKKSSECLTLDGILGKFIDKSDNSKFFTVFNLKKINHFHKEKFKFIPLQKILELENVSFITKEAAHKYFAVT